MIFTLKAPYDPDFYIRGKKVNRAFFIKHYKHSNTFSRIRVKSCLVDTLHVQPERSKREDFDFSYWHEALLNACPIDMHWAELPDKVVIYALMEELKMRCSEHCGNTVRKVQ